MPGGLDRRAVLLVHDARLRLHVGAVDGQRRHRPRQLVRRHAVAARAPAARPPARRCPRPAASLASCATSAKLRRVARHLLPEVRERLLGGRVDEQRGHVVEELVAHRAARPASRAARSPGRGSSPPRRAPRRRRAAAPGSRRGRPARRGGPRAARPRTPSRTSDSASLWVASNTSGSSWRTPASSSMSKKRRWRPVTGSMSKNFAPQLLVGPVAVGVVGRHVVGHDVEHDPEPGRARRAGQRAELLLAAERVRDRAAGRPRRSRASSPAAPGTRATR